MYPVLFHLGHFTLYSYGAITAVALLLAGLVLGLLLRRHGLRGDFAVEIVFSAAGGGFIGARLYWLVQHWSQTSPHLLASAFGGAGFTWYGGLLGGIVAVAAWSRARRLPIGLTANLAAPALALGYAVGRIACQVSGDGDYGRPSHLPWAMSYPHGTVPTLVRVQPTPIYETLAMLAVFWFLYRLAKRPQPGWSVFAWFLVLSGVERFAVEFLRRNPVWELGLTAPQWFALAGATLGIGVLVVQRQVATGASPAVRSGLGSAVRRARLPAGLHPRVERTTDRQT